MSAKPNHFTIYVPRDEQALYWIFKGAGIVAASEPTLPEMVHIHFEGNLYGAANLNDFNERVLSAAGRLREGYPTSAQAHVPFHLLHEIGALHYEQRKITIIDQAALDEWLAP